MTRRKWRRGRSVVVAVQEHHGVAGDPCAAGSCWERRATRQPVGVGPTSASPTPHWRHIHPRHHVLPSTSCPSVHQFDLLNIADERVLKCPQRHNLERAARSSDTDVEGGVTRDWSKPWWGFPVAAARSRRRRCYVETKFVCLLEWIYMSNVYKKIGYVLKIWSMWLLV